VPDAKASRKTDYRSAIAKRLSAVSRNEGLCSLQGRSGSVSVFRMKVDEAV